METTMAATPKARLASAAASSPELAFPVPPAPPSTARVMPAFAFPPMHGHPGGPEMRATRRTTVRVPREEGERDPLRDSLAGIASWIENAPLPSLPDSAWTFIGRAWFFLAGTTMGILLALAVIAGAGTKAAHPRHARAVVAASSARVLVIQRPATAAERGLGALAENDVVSEDPALADAPAAATPAPPAAAAAAAPARHPTLAARRPLASHRASSTKDILSAGL